MSQDTKYVYLSSPQWARISEIIHDFKGKDRTMAQYAKACGSISPSTLSRIANGKATRPLTQEIIICLYKNRDKDSIYELADLYKANGMIDEETNKRMSNIRATTSLREKIYREAKVREILTKELLNRGIGIKIQTNISPIDFSTSFVQRPDLAITLIEYDADKTWLFEFFTLASQKDSAYHFYRNLARHIFERISSTYLITDAWAPNTLQNMKTSFVFLDEDIYEAFREYFINNKLHNMMSTILIDFEAEKVIKEESLNHNQAYTQPSLFELPINNYEAKEQEEPLDNYPFMTSLESDFIHTDD